MAPRRPQLPDPGPGAGEPNLDRTGPGQNQTNPVSLQITKSFFSGVEDEGVQQKLLSVMFDLLVENPSPLLAATISSVFKRVSTDTYFLSNPRTRTPGRAGHVTPFPLSRLPWMVNWWPMSWLQTRRLASA